MWSHGLGSRTTAERVQAEHGVLDLWCVTTETFCERPDAYRFGVQSLFFLYGKRCPPRLLEMARGIPPFRPGTDEERRASVEARKAAVRALAGEVMAYLPQVIWRWDGRTPWEVGEDVNFIPSHRVPRCSIALKAEFGDRIIEQMFDPERTVIHFGLDWSEEHRIVKVRRAKPGWMLSAPLTEPPFLEKEQMADLARADGIEPSHAYSDGFGHDNCGGACFKAGQAAWARLFEVNPPLYLFNAQEEAAFLQRRGRDDVAILRDRRGGITKPLPLPVLATRVAGKDYDIHEWGGCGCFLGDS